MIVDVCTGSGALAVALARHRPAARVIGIDDSDAALDYARRNTEGTAVELVRADVTTPGLLPELDGRVDLVVANPPYVPDDVRLEPEVAQHDPPHAVFGGPDGMAVIAAVVGLAGRWLRPGGLFAVEHDDTTSSRTVELIEDTGLFEDSRGSARSGRPAEVRDGPIGGAAPMTEIFDCADPDQRSAGISLGGRGAQGRPTGRDADGHGLRHRGRRIRQHRGGRAVVGEGTRSRHAGGRAGRAPGTPSRAWSTPCRTGPAN